MNQEEAMQELKKGYAKAEKTLKNQAKVDELLERIEEKLKVIPKIGEQLSHIPVFIQLVKCFVTKKYTKIPIGSILAIVSALVYFLSPIDAIPDFLPGIGYVDDAAVIGACLLLVNSDVKEFIRWRDGNKQIALEVEN